MILKYRPLDLSRHANYTKDSHACTVVMNSNCLYKIAYGAKHGGHDFKAVNQIYDIWSKNIK